MADLGRCWATWETSQGVSSAALHRCDLDIGHRGLHETGLMQWSHGTSLLAPDPIRADDPVRLPISAAPKEER